MSIEVNLVVDTEKQKVVFAECGTDFADVLCSFLTLPLGIIVKLLNEQSELGCMDKLYKSVEDLDADKQLQTPPCKTMLLQPRSIAAKQCEGLVVNICDDLELMPRRVFVCSNWECASKRFPYYSSVSGVKCSSGKIMDRSMEQDKKVSSDGVFFEESAVQFLVSDDLHISIASSVTTAFPFLENHGIEDLKDFEERKIQVDKTQILALLKASLLSKTPLTDVFLDKPENNATDKIATSFTSEVKIENGASTKRQRDDDHGSLVTTVKILESDKLKLVEAGNDFVDQVFSFLTFPLGQVFSLLGRSCPTLGCIHNLYTSIDNMKGNSNAEILSAENKAMLLHTKLPPFSSCSNRLIQVGEILSQTYNMKNCKSCFDGGQKNCPHITNSVRLSELNPKFVKASSKDGGGFTRTNVRFIITNDMMVKPVSVISTLQFLKEMGISANSLKERTVIVDEKKALKFLEACLTSNTGIIDSLLS